MISGSSDTITYKKNIWAKSFNVTIAKRFPDTTTFLDISTHLPGHLFSMEAPKTKKQMILWKYFFSIFPLESLCHLIKWLVCFNHCKLTRIKILGKPTSNFQNMSHGRWVTSLLQQYGHHMRYHSWNKKILLARSKEKCRWHPNLQNTSLAWESASRILSSNIALVIETLS